MPIAKYTASADTTITNAYKLPALETRATGSNMGAADAMQIFSLYGQVSASAGIFTSVGKSRLLVDFSSSVGQIISDRTAATIPASGSVSFYLRMFNARTPFTLPKKFTLVVHPVSRSWQEGAGLDMETYIDTGYANWDVASSNSSGITSWTTPGGDYHTGAYVAGSTLPSYSQYFENGTEDLNINITPLVEEWIANTGGTATANYGVGVMLTSSQEDGSEKKSYYIKKFFARGTEYFFKRPVIEVRWDNSKKDDRGDFYLSSSLAPAADNLNTLYLYNYIRGKLRDIPAVGTSNILVSLYSGSTAPTSGKLALPVGGGVATDADLNITGTWVSTGIYSASFATTSSVSQVPTYFNRFARSSDTVVQYLYDVWHSASVEYFTGSGISPKTITASPYVPADEWVLTITNLKSSYKTIEKPRFRIFSRPQNWSPNIYTVATTAIKPTIIRDAYYKIVRVYDNLAAVPYGTGSIKYTQLSYDSEGSYFDFNMDLLESGYAYGIKIMSIEDGIETVHPETFKFRVE